MCVRVQYEHRQSRRVMVLSVRRSERLLSCTTMSMCLCASWRASLLVLARRSPLQPCWRWKPMCVALARSGFYTAEFVEKHSHNITVALSSRAMVFTRP